MEYECLEIEKGEYIKVLKCVSSEVYAKKQTAILIIPGNPGLIEFYEQFAIYLAEYTRLPIFGISHTGHLNGSSHGLSESWEAANLHTQISHKLVYLERHFKEKYAYKNLILIGHSIGSHVLLNIANNLDKIESSFKVVKSICIFPTVERMASSPQGKKLTPLLEYFLWLFLPIAYVVSKLPLKLVDCLIRWSFGMRKNQHDIDENVVRTATEMLTSFSCLKSLAVMARHEMRLVKDFDYSLLENRLHDTIMYYGTQDHWCPLNYYENMKKKLQDLYPDYRHNSCLLVDDNKCDHAFVVSLKQTEYISKKVATWIRELIT